MSAAIALIFVSEVSAQMNRGFTKVVELTPSQADEMWSTFKRSKISGDYAMGFTITHSPRRGEDVEYVGEMYGTRVGDETLTRVRVKKADTKDSPISDFILSNHSKECKVWRSNGDKFEEIKKADWHKPLVEGLIFSPFDLLTPYIHRQPKYVGGGRIGQAVYFFDLFPSADESAQDSKKVRIAITREFNSPAQTEIFDSNGKLEKIVSLGSVKKFDGLWIIHELSARDENTRDKDKLRFRAATVKTVVPLSTFDPKLKPREPHRLEMKRL